MAHPWRDAPQLDEGSRWLRQLTEAVAGWARGELDSPLPDWVSVAGLPSELIELHAGLESVRRVLQAQRTQPLRGKILA